MEDTEKRRSKRSEFRQPVAFELSVTMAEQPDDSLLRSGMGIDISSTGMGLETDFLPLAGDLVKLLIPFAGSDVNMPVFAEVQWVEANRKKHRLGLRFLA